MKVNGVMEMGLLDKFSDAQRSVQEKTKNMSEASNLKRKILYEEERIGEVFQDLGKRYYKNPNEDPASLKVLCDDIDTRRRRIKKMRYELNQIRGYKICPKCGAEVNDRFQFCGRCGARLPEMDDDDFESLEPNDYYTESSNSFFNADSNKNY